MNEDKARTLPVGTYYVSCPGDGWGENYDVRQVVESGSRLVAMFGRPPKRTSRLVATFHRRWSIGIPEGCPKEEAEATAEALNELEFIPDRYGDNVIVRKK
jgi:hypothetical protein